MKVLTVVGARPQFIKAAVVSRELRKLHQEVLLHTGQHYDYNMSDVFFEELDIPKPDYNLGISGGSHGKMTGEMLIKIEEVLLKEKPDMMLVYGDTNSTMAGALAAVKLNIPVCHVEAGARLGTLTNPEEVNRITTDNVSSILACCTASAVEFLRKEGKTKNVYLVGDPMFDAFEFYRKKVGDTVQEELIGLQDETLELPAEYYYMTCHRQENTGTDCDLQKQKQLNPRRDYILIRDQLPVQTVADKQTRQDAKEGVEDGEQECEGKGGQNDIKIISGDTQRNSDSVVSQNTPSP